MEELTEVHGCQVPPVSLISNSDWLHPCLSPPTPESPPETKPRGPASTPGSKRSEIREWAQLHDVDRIRFYEDPGVSSGTIDREGLQRLLSDVEDGDIGAVVVYKADRLSWSLKDLLTVLDGILEPNGVRFVYATEQFDTSTASGWPFLQRSSGSSCWRCRCRMAERSPAQSSRTPRTALMASERGASGVSLPSEGSSSGKPGSSRIDTGLVIV